MPDLRADAVRAADRIAASLASDFAKQAAEAAASDDDAEPDFNATREEPASAVLRKGDVTGGDDS